MAYIVVRERFNRNSRDREWEDIGIFITNDNKCERIREF